MKKVPLRRCVITNTMIDKKELIRIVKTKDGEVFLDHSGRANGRGAYLSKNVDINLFLKKKHLIEKSLNIKIPENVIEEIRGLLKKDD